MIVKDMNLHCPSVAFDMGGSPEYEKSMAEAKSISDQVAGGFLLAHPNEAFTYRGVIAGETQFHVVQKLHPGKTSAIHDKRHIPFVPAANSWVAITLDGTGGSVISAAQAEEDEHSEKKKTGLRIK